METKRAPMSVKLVETYRKAAGQINPEYHYKGLRIHARFGLHEYVAEKVTKYLQPGAKILDLGAGSGAMSLRLHELGFEVIAVDYVSEAFALHDRVPFKQVDLNSTFSEVFDGQFDGIIAIEIIEHLENPRNLFRECRKLLKEDGILFMTTPNIDNAVSKTMFLRQGTFQWFSDYNYETEGHISPLGLWQFDKLIRESMMVTKDLSSFGDAFESARKHWKKFYCLAKYMQMFTCKGTNLLGEILVIVLTLQDNCISLWS
jgi:2-polyprenyl-3-methyl-5-hydroxy-6-metoxy-1,4-benzoquinol methylase